MTFFIKQLLTLTKKYSIISVEAKKTKKRKETFDDETFFTSTC